MKLIDFLETASADDIIALAEAREHKESTLKDISMRMVNERTVFGLIGNVSGEGFMMALETAPSELIPDRVKAWFKPSEHGIDISSKSATDIINSMATGGVITEGEAEALKGYAFDVTTPFTNATLYDVKHARGSLESISVSVVAGYAVINVTAECELHNPQVFDKNTRLDDEPQRINGFRGVGVAGKYECLIPPEWRASELFVNNAYGVIEAV
jgi:hypothetical protein